MPILDWVDKDKALKAADGAQYRLLEEVPDLSFGDADNENMLIQGDNLDALKALIPYYAGRIKCIFIDPPYNTGSAFEHYDDNLQHSEWLSLMYPRLELLRELLSEDGTIWMTIDDDEAHYLKVTCDEVFGRKNFVANVVWQKKFSPQNDATWLSDNHDHILAYAKNKNTWRPNRVARSEKSLKNYKNPDNDPRGVWASVDYTCNKSKEARPNLYFSIKNPNTGETIWPKSTAVWRFNPERHERNVKDNLVWWGKNGTNSVPRYKRFFRDVQEGSVPLTIWMQEEVGNTQEARKESLVFNNVQS